MDRRSRLMLMLLLVTSVAFPLHGQPEAPVRINLPAGEWIDSTAPVEIHWVRPLTAEEGRLALFLDETDITDLFVPAPQGLRYDTSAMPLPSGRRALVVWLVSPAGEWRELTRANIAIRTPRGFETAEIRPSLDLSSRGQLQEDAFPETNLNPRGDHFDGTVQLGLQGDHQRGGWGLKSDVRTTGVSYAPEALRFSAEGEQAPRFDLASHSLQFGRGKGLLSVGNVSFGTNRHLVSGFGSRGLVLDLPVGRVMTLRLGAMNGTSIVGWDNITGLAENDHLLLGAALAFELIPSRPGGLMAEISWLDASLLPLDNFNQGSIRSSETSSGLGLRLATTTPSQRFTAEGGYTFSRFEDGVDEELDGGLQLVQSDDQRRSASYLDTSVALIQARPITERHQLNLNAAFRFERIEPLYRSIGASVQSDLQRGVVDVSGNAGPFVAQLLWSSQQDNLEGLRTVLETQTRQAQLNLGLQLGSFLSDPARASWLPLVSVAFTRIHQYGAFLPDNPEFVDSHVPDQVSTNASASIEWSLGRSQFGYRWNGSGQDNRQTGRERADSRAATNGLFWAIALGDRLSVNLDVGRDSFENLELGREDTTDRSGVTFNWRLIGQTSLAANLTHTRASDNRNEQRNRSIDSWAEISSGFPLGRGAAGRRTARLFLRMADRESQSRNLIFGTDDEQRGMTVTTGVNLSLQ